MFLSCRWCCMWQNKEWNFGLHEFINKKPFEARASSSLQEQEGRVSWWKYETVHRFCRSWVRAESLSVEGRSVCLPVVCPGANAKPPLSLVLWNSLSWSFLPYKPVASCDFYRETFVLCCIMKATLDTSNLSLLYEHRHFLQCFL